MNRTTNIIAAIGILLAFAVPALAITGTVERIIIQAAANEELDETVLEPGLLVYRVDDPKDVRIGDGMTAGGISLWNYLALTNPPSPYDRDLDMEGHAIELNSHYRIVAEGGYLSIYHIGTNPVFRLVGSESAGTLGILESVTVGTNIVITVQHVDGDAPPVLEGATDISDPVWTPVEYDLDRLSSITVTLTFPQPETGVFTYYRVSTSVSDPMANFLVPVLVDGSPVLTAETDPAWTAASGSVVYATTPGYTAAVEQAASAYGWGDHAAGSIYLPTATNSYIRPDGGTNAIYFDAASNMVIAVDGSPALTISPAGDVGVGTTPSHSFSLRTDASFYAGGGVRAGAGLASLNGKIYVNNTLNSYIELVGTNLMFTATNGVTGRIQMIYE